MGVGGQRHVPASLPPGTTRYTRGPQGRSKAVREQVLFYCVVNGPHTHTLPDSAVHVCPLLKVCGYRHAPAVLPSGTELRVPIGEKLIHALTVNSYSYFITDAFSA
jgi:hypothetical protein